MYVQLTFQIGILQQEIRLKSQRLSQGFAETTTTTTAAATSVKTSKDNTVGKDKTQILDVERPKAKNLNADNTAKRVALGERTNAVLPAATTTSSVVDIQKKRR